MESQNNYISLCGAMSELPKFSHVGGNETYMTFPLEVRRLSGVCDTINIIVRKTLLDSIVVKSAAAIAVIGEVRSFNNKSGVGSRLVISVFARDIELVQAEGSYGLLDSEIMLDVNIVQLTGIICKQPTLRRTPMGRQICDVMLAVNRRHNRSDYLPCIAWGRVAQAISECEVGEKIAFTGRIQSRKYIKTMPDGPEERTAYEISVISLDEKSAAPLTE